MTSHLVTDGIESALSQARAAAGDANVDVAGGHARPLPVSRWASAARGGGRRSRELSDSPSADRHSGESESEGDVTMRYMMFVCSDTEPDTDGADLPDIEAWVEENDAAGRRLLGNALAPISSATTVRVRNGELLVSDGPFAETKELILGFDLLDCADLDDAIEVARAHPMARSGRLEIRPLADVER